MSPPDGGPAFPVLQKCSEEELNGWWSKEKGIREVMVPGMSLRSYFVAHAPYTAADVLTLMRESLKDLSEEERKQAVLVFLVDLNRAYADRMLRALSLV